MNSRSYEVQAFSLQRDTMVHYAGSHNNWSMTTTMKADLRAHREQGSDIIFNLSFITYFSPLKSSVYFLLSIKNSHHT